MSDLGKANDIINKKMEDARTLKEKYRRNTEVIKKQEKLLHDKDDDIKVHSLIYVHKLPIFIFSIFENSNLSFKSNFLVEL